MQRDEDAGAAAAKTIVKEMELVQGTNTYGATLARALAT